MKSDNKSQEIKINNPKKTNTKKDLEIKTDKLVLKAIGYPFNFSLMETNLEITNEALFEEYCKEQWLGLEVSEGSYLFDQKIIPDYGFEIISAKPNNSVINDNTKITIIQNPETVKKDIQTLNTDLKIKDVIGQENAKNKIKVISKYLEAPKKFGKWAPHNILFYGLPGTGKTMLAQALANELDVPLYLIKATSLIGDHVGDGARQIHELFESATKTSPAIIFIDEVDAIALHRQYQSLRGDVSEIVNSLLTELDGINPNTGVITIAATNNPNFLDFAVRSRFEEEIKFELPNEESRTIIIKNNLNTFPLDVDFDLEKVVKLSKGMSGRDIKEKLLKTALHHAISNDKTSVTMKDIEYALTTNKHKIDKVNGMFQ